MGPTIAAHRKFGVLVITKNATLRRATYSEDKPPRRSAQAPSASPPAPPVGNSTFVACSAIPSR